MTSVSNFFAFERSRSDISRLQSDLVDLQRQTASGFRAENLAGYGRQSGQVLSARSLISASEARNDALRGLEPRLSTQDLAFSQFDGAIGVLRSALENAIALDSPADLPGALDQAFADAVEALNQDFGGSFLFGGERSDSAPVQVSSLAQLRALPDAAAAFANGARPQTFDVGGGVTTNVAPLASDIGREFFEALRSVAAFAEANPTGPLSATNTGEVRDLLNGLEGARQNVLQAQVENGGLQNQVKQQRLTEERRLVVFKSALGEAADADIAEVATRISQLTAQFQATAQVFVQVRDLSLLNFLR